MRSDGSRREMRKYNLFEIALEVAKILDRGIGGKTVEARARDMEVLLEFQSESWEVYSERLFACIRSLFCGYTSALLIVAYRKNAKGLSEMLLLMAGFSLHSEIETGRTYSREELLPITFSLVFNAMASADPFATLSLVAKSSRPPPRSLCS